MPQLKLHPFIKVVNGSSVYEPNPFRLNSYLLTSPSYRVDRLKSRIITFCRKKDANKKNKSPGLALMSLCLGCAWLLKDIGGCSKGDQLMQEKQAFRGNINI